MTDRNDPAVIWALPPDETGIRGDYHTSTLSGAVRYIRADLVAPFLEELDEWAEWKASQAAVAEHAGWGAPQCSADERAAERAAHEVFDATSAELRSQVAAYRQALSGEPQ